MADPLPQVKFPIGLQPIKRTTRWILYYKTQGVSGYQEVRFIVYSIHYLMNRLILYRVYRVGIYPIKRLLDGLSAIKQDLWLPWYSTIQSILRMWSRDLVERYYVNDSEDKLPRDRFTASDGDTYIRSSMLC